MFFSHTDGAWAFVLQAVVFVAFDMNKIKGFTAENSLITKTSYKMSKKKTVGQVLQLTFEFSNTPVPAFD